MLAFATNTRTAKDVVQALEQLFHTLSSVSSGNSGLDAKLADYVFFPLSHVLRESQKLPPRALELCLLCIAILLESGWQKNIATNLSGQLLILLTFMAGNVSPGKRPERPSEELQVAALRCLSLLFLALGRSQSGRKSLITTANAPQLGHTITVMLDRIVDGSSSEIQLSALSALQSLLDCLLDDDIVANFLPGITSSLTKILTPSTKSRRAYRLLEGALKLLARLFTSVLSDRKTEDLPSETVADETNDTKDGSLRTKPWLQATSGQIKQALANIFKNWQHDRQEVRHALSDLCIAILQDCRRSLNESANMTLETLVMLSQGGSENSGHSRLNHLIAVDPSLCELLRSSLRIWVVSLPRIMESNDDVAKRRLIHRVALAYQLLADQDIDLANVDMIMAANLRDSVALAIKDTNALAESNGNELSLRSIDTVPVVKGEISIKFDNILEGRRGQRDTVMEIRALLKQLTTSKSAESLVQDLLQSVENSTGEARVASLWLAVESSKKLSENSSIDQYLNFGNPGMERRDVLLERLYAISLDILTNSDENEEHDWRLQALALEMFALQAQQQKEGFREELIDALYPVVHLIGCPIDPLRQHATVCLNLLANACGYKNAGDLIVSNVDYLTNAVAFKLNGPAISPQAPMVLLMMVKLSGPPLIPYLDDIIGSIFVTLEQYHGYTMLVELLFAVLRVVVEESVKAPQLAITDHEDDSETNRQFQPTKWNDIIEVIKNFQQRSSEDGPTDVEEVERDFPKQPWGGPSHKPNRPRNLVEEISLPSDAEEDSEALPEERADPGPPVPKTYNLLLKISQLTQHYLPSASSQFRASLLSLLDVAIPAIASHENSFLPLINTLWPVLVSRLDDPEAHVVASTLNTIGLLCKHAGQFMKGRIEDVWPSIMDLYDHHVLKQITDATSGKHAKAHQGAKDGRDLVLRDLGLQRHSTAAYVDVPTRTIRKALAEASVMFASYVPVSEETFDDILHMLGPLLEEQEDIRRLVDRRNPDAVWLAMAKRNAQVTRRLSDSDESSGALGSLSTIPSFPKSPQRVDWSFVTVAL